MPSRLKRTAPRRGPRAAAPAPGEQLTFVVEGRDEGARLDALLRAHVPTHVGVALSNGAVRRAIVAGAVTIGRRVCKVPGAELHAGDRVSIAIDRDRLLPPPSIEAQPGSVAILFEDEWLVAVDKPAGLPSVPSADPRRPSLVRVLEAQLSVRDRRDVRLGVHQRLDVDTSGLVLFTTDTGANAPLARAFARHEVEKTYHALVADPGRDVPAQRIDAPLARTTGRAGRVIVSADGAPAVTDIRVVGRANGVLRVEACPRTGRQHQIRAHLASIGLPILGDVRYGGARRWRDREYQSVQLRAVRLSFDHPVTGQRMSIEASS